DNVSADNVSVDNVSVDNVCEKLRTEGRRITPQRRAIVAVLLEDDSHLTADQVLTRVRRKLPDISPATVYNTLHQLSAMGFLQELDLGLGFGERRYQIAAGKHDHLVCLCCGRIEDVPRRGHVKPAIEQDHDFKIVDRRVIYLGYCPHCASNPEVQLIINRTE
ncbi:MAG: Fur family transcriptional regulator, partial [Anaerolineae bacterium]